MKCRLGHEAEGCYPTGYVWLWLPVCICNGPSAVYLGTLRRANSPHQRRMISLMNETEKYWFQAKSYGWGWGLPLTWQGWVVYGTFGLLLVGANLFFPPASSPWAFSMCVLVLSAAVVGICYAKGEPPKWRWGAK